MRCRTRVWLARCIGLWLLIHSSVWAGEALPAAAEPALEARLMALAAELRCLVCQNQSLADSHAELAIDLKNQVREQLRAGRTNEQIIDYMTQRYGDFILYRPPLRRTTLLLWGGPLLLLLGGALWLWKALDPRTGKPPEEGFVPADASHLLRLLEPQVSEATPPSGAEPVDALRP